MQDANGNSLEGKTLSWQKAAGHENEKVLWEPGCKYQLQPITIKNNGNLKLKYKINISGVTGNAKLLEALSFNVVGVTSTTTITDLNGFEGALEPGAKTNPITIQATMNQNAGNEYQGLSIENIGITVQAAQLGGTFGGVTGENDSFNNSYDLQATYPPLASYLNNTVKANVASASDNKTSSQTVISDTNAVSTVPAETMMYSSYTNESTNTHITLGTSGSLERQIKTTASSAESVTYDISYKYTSGETSTDVTKFSNIVENVLEISSGLKNVTVTSTHNGVTTQFTMLSAMPESPLDKQAYYDFDEGKVYVWSSEYSTFDISFTSDYEVAVDGQGMSLAAFRDSVNAGNSYAGKTVVLLRNLDLSGSEWTPIGQKNGNKFSGVFDGKNFKVEGMTISNTTEIQNSDTFDGYAAFFGAINGGTVKNLSVYGTVNSKNAAGVVARVDGNSSVINCHNYATVTALSNGKAGGVICLTNNAAISVQYCTNSGTVSGGNSGTAGIVGYANAGVTISDCSNFGNIGDENCKYSGGIVGFATGDNATGSITKCSNSGIIVAHEECGGIVGIITGSQNVSDCTNTQSVQGTDTAFSGGIVGGFAGGTIKDCTNTASVHGKFAGGVVGSAQKGVIENCSGGTAAITSPAFKLGFTNQNFTLSVGENQAAGRILGTNQGSDRNNYTVLKLANNEDDQAIGTVGMCGNLTTWANLKISSGTFYGEPLAGNTTYITLEAGATWGNKAAGTYYCGGLTESSRIATWQIKN